MDLKLALVGLFAAGVGLLLPGAAGRRIGPPPDRPIAVAASVFVLPGQVRLLRNLHGAWGMEWGF